MRCMKHNNVIVTDTGKWCEPLYCPELISSVYQLLTNTSEVPCSFLARVTFLVFVLWWLLVELSDINKPNLEIICFTWTLTTMRFYFQFNFPSQEIYQIVNVLWAAFMSFLSDSLLLHIFELCALIYFKHASKMHFKQV